MSVTQMICGTAEPGVKLVILSEVTSCLIVSYLPKYVVSLLLDKTCLLPLTVRLNEPHFVRFCPRSNLH